MPLLGAVRKAVARNGLLLSNDVVLVAVSGGPDSLCLLHVLVGLREEYGLTLHVAHLNHSLRGDEGDADAEYVRQTADEWGVGFSAGMADVRGLAAAQNIGVEEAARRARYAFLAGIACRVGAGRVAVGHHADDQAETVLMHLLRGSGLTGLRGMRPAVPLRDVLGLRKAELPQLSRAVLIRPLLAVPRAEIEAYCRQHQLRPRMDHTNRDVAMLRNRIRHQILPQLEQVSPGLGGRLGRLAEVISADLALLEELLDEQWPDLLLDSSDRAVTLDLVAWRALPLGLRRAALRRAIQSLQGMTDLGFNNVEDARRVAEQGETGAQASLPGRLRARVSYGRLLVSDEDYYPPPPADWPLLADDQPVALAIPGLTPLRNSGWLAEARLLPADAVTRAATEANTNRWVAFLDADAAGADLTLRPRRPGERFQPLGLSGRSNSVSDFMIDARIPAAWRERVPLLVSSSHVLWIAGWRLDERVRVTEQTRRILHITLQVTA